MPGTRKTVGVAIALPGLLLCLYGYASGVYIAFTEDDLYGWLYLLIPFYAAYYCVSRWDEMRSRLIMIVVGLILLVDRRANARGRVCSEAASEAGRPYTRQKP